MRLISFRPFRFLSKPVARVIAGAGFSFVLLLSPVLAQRPLEDRAKPGMERIDPEEGPQRLAEFRQQRLAGDFVFEFELEHKPRRARTERYEGIMWGTWNRAGARSRIRLYKDKAVVTGAAADRTYTEWIIQNGPHPEAWIREAGAANFQPVRGAYLFEPVLEGLSYSLFDLQMPFIYWPDFEYVGPELVGATRVAQQFLLRPPAGSASEAAGIDSVRIGLDDTYNALLRVEVLGPEDFVQSRFQVESFQKVDEQYIVKKITLTDYPEKDRTTFHVLDASVGLVLDPALFSIPAEAAPDASDSSAEAGGM